MGQLRCQHTPLAQCALRLSSKMMLGRALRSMASPALRSFKPPQAAARNASSIPQTLSVRMDGLFIQCCIAAIIHFVPQDVIFLGGILYMTHATASAKSPKRSVGDRDAAVEAFKAKKGIDN